MWVELPETIFHLLVRVVRTMREGKAVVLLPESESMTTQAAADFLGVSRPSSFPHPALRHAQERGDLFLR